MCFPLRVKHTAAGVEAELSTGKKAAVSSCKSQIRRLSAVESEMRPSNVFRAGPPSQPTHCGVELGAWGLNWGNASSTNKRETTHDFLPLTVTEVPGGTHCTHREVCEGT